MRPVKNAFSINFKAILEGNYQNPKLNMDIICEKIHLSQSYLTRKIKALLGVSPYQYLRIYRIQKTAQVLKSGYQGSMAQFAEAMGFSSQQHFINNFESHFGVLPKDCRVK